MEEVNEDYIMILDYHDDSVVCNSDILNKDFNRTWNVDK